MLESTRPGSLHRIGARRLLKQDTIVRPNRRRLRLTDYDYSSPGAYFLTIVTSGRDCLFGEAVDSVMQTNAAGVMVEDWWARLESKFPWVTADESIVMPNHVLGILLVGADPRVRPSVGDRAGVLPGVEVAADPRVRPSGGDRAGVLPSGEVGADPRVRPPGGDRAGVLPSGEVGADPRVRPSGGDRAGVLPSGEVGADPRVRPSGGQRAETIPKVMQWFKTMTTNAYIRGVRTKGWEPFQARLWQRSYYERVIRNENELYQARRYIAGNPSKWTEDVENPANGRRSG